MAVTGNDNNGIYLYYFASITSSTWSAESWLALLRCSCSGSVNKLSICSSGMLISQEGQSMGRRQINPLSIKNLMSEVEGTLMAGLLCISAKGTMWSAVESGSCLSMERMCQCPFPFEAGWIPLKLASSMACFDSSALPSSFNDTVSWTAEYLSFSDHSLVPSGLGNWIYEINNYKKMALKKSEATTIPKGKPSPQSVDKVKRN